VRVLIDTDVLLDVALNRKGYVAHSAEALRWIEESGGGFIAWHTISNCAYLLKDPKRQFLKMLLSIVRVAKVGHEDAEAAFAYQMRDFEDALQCAAAVSCGADYIITRNLADYKKSPIKALSPKEFLALK